MANRFYINISFPVMHMNESREKQQLRALWYAENEWKKVAKEDPSKPSKEKDVFIASQPDVPFEKTKNKIWEYHPKTGHKIPTDKLAPDNQQWYVPSISADFWEDENGHSWVQPRLAFEVNDPRYPSSSLFVEEFYPIRVYKHSFPWWAQIGFAGAKTSDDTSDSQIPYLWELPVKDVIKNLKYCEEVNKNIPVSGTLRQWLWAADEISKVQEMTNWFSMALQISDQAKATLDWRELDWYDEPGDPKKFNEPNEIMAITKRLDRDIKKLASRKLSQKNFRAKWAKVDDEEK